MIGDYGSKENPTDGQRDSELELLLEVARRANWAAMHGPQYLRSGRFCPSPAEELDAAGEARPGAVGDIPPARRARPDGA